MPMILPVLPSLYFSKSFFSVLPGCIAFYILDYFTADYIIKNE